MANLATQRQAIATPALPQHRFARSGDQFYFNLQAAGNAEVILTSERYTRKMYSSAPARIAPALTVTSQNAPQLPKASPAGVDAAQGFVP